MTNLRYGDDAIRAWAEFSGDFNPIHFEPVVAARVGLPDLPVHGMRVMLDVKSALYRAALGNPALEQDSLLFKATLRAPVLRERQYRLDIEQTGKRLKFSVCDQIGGKTCINGYLGPASAREVEGDGCGQHCAATPAVAHFAPLTVEATTLEQQMARFVALSDEVQPAWALVDALLFRHLLVHGGELFGDVARAFGIDGVASASALMRDVAVLQTHHQTLIPPALCSLESDALPALIGARKVRLQIGPPLMTAEPGTGLAINGSLVARADAALLTRISIGLLALPAHSSPQ